MFSLKAPHVNGWGWGIIVELIVRWWLSPHQNTLNKSRLSIPLLIDLNL